MDYTPHPISNAAFPAWLLKGNVTQLVLVLLSKDTRTPLERWTFNVDLVAPPGEGSEPYVPAPPLSICHILPHPCSAPSKPEAEVQKEIRHIIKQIVASVTFLPLVYEPTVFNILVYTKDSADVPEQEWLDTDAMAIEAGLSQQVRAYTEQTPTGARRHTCSARLGTRPRFHSSGLTRVWARSSCGRSAPTSTALMRWSLIGASRSPPPLKTSDHSQNRYEG
jgi:hypothetical protein